MKKEGQKGFTLIEVLLVVAIMSIIVTVSLSSWQSFSDATNLGNTAKMIETKIKLAKSYSLSAANDVNYGIHMEAGSVTIFPADAAYVFGDPENQVFALTDGVEIYDGAGNNIVFGRLTGATADSGVIGIRIANNPSKTKVITVNSQGQTGADIFQTSPRAPILEDPDNGINSRHIHFNLSAWTIQNAAVTAKLILEWSGAAPVVENIDTAAFFNAGIFDWQGTVAVDGAAQKLRIHTLDAGGSVLCVMRDRMQNSKTLKISFLDNGITKEIAVYTEKADGSISVSPNYTFVYNPIEAQ